ncbi:hypothetical protein SAMN02745181_3015 [Rubritalea squalenifaciens DSM 18772]|uniref:Virus attachment protein p12 family protein n=2 Tax=Rubritalea TaxID=361050 RepID=A0A1M6NYA4_9BACT|nr:hypothetical protein [Rubritalea squalenifaciens]SHK00727.1 hypothetical protein SAMN02745181_3015 [Rubritalea squalenifaciens DSM 18772]
MTIKNTIIAATGFLALTGFAMAESDGGCKGGGCKGKKGDKTEKVD